MTNAMIIADRSGIIAVKINAHVSLEWNVEKYLRIHLLPLFISITH